VVCIVDFDKTFLKNDFFKERFYRVLIYRPLELILHFIIQQKSLLELKHSLLSSFEINYQIDSLINEDVKKWIIDNRQNYDKVIIVSASPDFFVKRVLKNITLFDEIHGSQEINLKGKKKLAYIVEKWGNKFDYIGDSRVDIPIFKACKNAFKLTKKGVVYVK